MCFLLNVLFLFCLFCCIFHCVVALLKNWTGCVFYFLLAIFPEMQHIPFSHPRKSLVCGHVLISFSFVCCSSCCLCFPCGCCCLGICFVGPFSKLFLWWLFILLLFCNFFWLLFWYYSCWLVLISTSWFLLCWFSWFLFFTKFLLVFLFLFFFLLFHVDFSCCCSSLGLFFFRFSSFLLWLFLLIDVLSFCFPVSVLCKVVSSIGFCFIFLLHLLRLASFVCVSFGYFYLAKVLFFPSTAWGGHWKGFTLCEAFHTWRSTAIAFLGTVFVYTSFGDGPRTPHKTL